MTNQWTISDEQDLGFEDNTLVEKQETTEEKVEAASTEIIEIPDGPIKSEEEFAKLFGAGEKVETKEESTETPAVTADAEFLKAKALYKAAKYGIEIDEDQEFDDETYQAFEDQLDEMRLEQKYEQVKNSDEFFKAIFEIAENDGDVNQLLDLYSERRELTQIDTSTLEGKVEKIRKYYKDIEGKPDVWINKQIKLLSTGEDTKELEDEFDLISGEYDKYFAEEKERQVQATKQLKLQKEAAVKRQVSNFENTLKNKKLDQSKISEMSSFVYNDKKYRLKDSNETISAFDAAILTARNNPEELADLVDFLKDKKAYNERVIVQAKNITNEKVFDNKVKTNGNGAAAQTVKKPKFQFIK